MITPGKRQQRRKWNSETAKYRVLGKILEATKHWGEIDKVTTFADGLNIPIGVIPINNGALVYSIPNIYQIWASDGGDRAEELVERIPFARTDVHSAVAAAF